MNKLAWFVLAAACGTFGCNTLDSGAAAKVTFSPCSHGPITTTRPGPVGVEKMTRPPQFEAPREIAAPTPIRFEQKQPALAAPPERAGKEPAPEKCIDAEFIIASVVDFPDARTDTLEKSIRATPRATAEVKTFHVSNPPAGTISPDALAKVTNVDLYEKWPVSCPRPLRSLLAWIWSSATPLWSAIFVYILAPLIVDILKLRVEIVRRRQGKPVNAG